MKIQPYPFLFRPYLKEVLWGGQRLYTLKGLPAEGKRIGESWEICGIRDHASMVLNGPLAGLSLRRLIDLFGERLLGKHIQISYGKEFPLLIKYIDAAQDLSLQVHPDDDMARELCGQEARGKTEIWYVMDASPGARLYSGFSREVTRQVYRGTPVDDHILSLFACHKARRGDVFFLPAGRVHAIGAGCLIAEIQQSSDITYRIYDYNRRDKDGNLRTLHTLEAERAINFEDKGGCCVSYQEPSESSSSLVDCPYFHTSLVDCRHPLTISLAERDSFTVIQCIDGRADAIVDGLYNVHLTMGSTVLIPAQCQMVTFVPDVSARFIETYA